MAQNTLNGFVALMVLCDGFFSWRVGRNNAR